jgi:type II secretory pathway pseudopilin PulG
MRASARGERTGDRGQGEAGSVFVESMIAAAIVAMVLAATFRVIGDSAARERGTEARRAALLVAQSTLADVGSEIPIAPGHTAGAWGDLAWGVDIESYGSGGAQNVVGDLYAVTVRVRPRSGGAPLASLRSLRLGPGA